MFLMYLNSNPPTAFDKTLSSDLKKSAAKKFEKELRGRKIAVLKIC